MLNDEKELQYYRSAEIQTIINEGKEYKKNLLEDYNKSLEILNNERERLKIESKKEYERYNYAADHFYKSQSEFNSKIEDTVLFESCSGGNCSFSANNINYTNQSEWLNHIITGGIYNKCKSLGN